MSFWCLNGDCLNRLVMAFGRALSVEPSLLIAAWICALLPGAAEAQDGPGGARGELTFSERFLSDEDGEFARTDLGFSLFSTTRSQFFNLSLNTGIEKDLSNGLASELEDPRAALSYGLSNRNTALSFDANYVSSDVSRLTPLDPLDATSAFVIEDADRETIRGGMQFDFGRASRFGGSLTLNYAAVQFVNTSSTALIDSDTGRAGLILRFEIDPRITARTTFNLTDLDRRGGQDIRTEQLGAGATLLVSSVLSADIDVGSTRVKQSGIGINDTNEGAFYDLALQLARPNGELRGEIRSDIDENGRRTTLRVDRALELPRGSLNFGIGASQDDETNGIDPLYSLSYSREGPRSNFSAGLEQIFSTDTAGNETLDSRVNMALNHELSALSSLDTRLTLRDTRNDAPGTGDIQQLDLDLDYTRALGRDWDFIAGYTYTRQDQDGGANSTENRVFIGLRLTRGWQR